MGICRPEVEAGGSGATGAIADVVECCLVRVAGGGKDQMNPNMLWGNPPNNKTSPLF